MVKMNKEVKFSFAESFKCTIQRYENLSPGHKADFERSSKNRHSETKSKRNFHKQKNFSQKHKVSP